MSMPLQHIEEELSLAAFTALLSINSFTYALYNLDYGIDLEVCGIQNYNGKRIADGPFLSVQLKAAKLSTKCRRTDSCVKYSITKDAYDRLNKVAPGRRKLLALFVLPENETDWMLANEHNILIKHSIYFLFHDQLPVWQERKKSITIEIPVANLLTVETLGRVLAEEKQRVFS